MFKKIVSIIAITIILGGIAEARTYKLFGKAPLGRKLKPIEATAPYPFDKEYHQLSKNQRASYRAQWEGLKENDTPPFPKGGTISIYGPLLKGHERIARGGMLRLVAQIDEKGIVQELAIYESPHKDITELATSVIFYTEFQPATCDGKPCKMDFPFEFELRQRAKQTNSLNAEDIPGRDIK